MKCVNHLLLFGLHEGNNTEAMAEHLDISLGRLLSANNTNKQEYIDEIIAHILMMDDCDIESIIEFIKYYNRRKEVILNTNKTK